jgi:hypothetical protein
MATRVYMVLRDDWGWAFRSPHQLSRTYATQEAAILSALGEIRREVAEGNDVELTVGGRKFLLRS